MKKNVRFLFIFVFLIFGCSVKANPNIEISNEIYSCYEILGSNLTKVVHAFINILQISAVIISIVYGMIILVPPVLAKDSDEVKKATSKLIKIGVILLIILLFRPIIRFIGNVLEFDLSCIF